MAVSRASRAQKASPGRAWRTLRAAAALACVLVAGAQGASAQSAEDDFSRGLAAMQAGRFEDAALALEAARARSPQPLVLFHLGITYASLGWPHEAVARFEAFLLVADPVADAARVAAVQSELARLRGESTVLVLRVSPPDAALVVDGRPTTLSRGELLLAPGLRELSVRADGYTRHAQRIDAKPGRFLLDIALPPAFRAAASAASTAPPAPPPAASLAAPAPPSAAEAPRPEPTPPSEPATVPAAPATTLATRDEIEQEIPSDVPCAGGDWCLGPVVTLGALGLVGPGFHVNYGDHLGFGIDFQLLPSITIGDGAVSLYVLTGSARLYPFANAGFFLSAGLSFYGAKGSAAVANPMTGEIVEGEGSVTFPGIALGIGFMGHDGFIVGIGLAAIFPIGNTAVDFRIVRGDPQSPLAVAAERNVRSATDDVLDALPFIPQLDLLRVGYLF